MSKPNTPEGDNKPKYDPRFPEGLGTWRKKLYSDEELEALAEKNKQTDTGQVPAETPIDKGLVEKRLYAAGIRGRINLTDLSHKMAERVSKNREPRNINDIQPEEFGTYLSVPGWRIWERTIFAKGAYLEAAKAAESKELVLRSNQHNKGYSYIYYKLEDAEMARDPKRPRMPFGPGAMAFDMPWYVLEPLTAEEVKTIDELGEVPGPVGSVDRSAEILRPEELKKILTEPNTRFRPIKFPPATI